MHRVITVDIFGMEQRTFLKFAKLEALQPMPSQASL